MEISGGKLSKDYGYIGIVPRFWHLFQQRNIQIFIVSVKDWTVPFLTHFRPLIKTLDRPKNTPYTAEAKKEEFVLFCFP